MSSKTSLLAVTLAAAATGCGDSPDPCNEPGTACVWAGIGERGYNIENETANRLESKLYYPMDVTFGPDGLGYIVDWNNHRIRRVEKNDTITNVVGTDYEGDGPPQMQDRLPVCNPTGAPADTVAGNHITDVEFGPDGLMYIATWHNNKIRVWDPETKLVTVLAGDGYGFQGDGGEACHSLFNQPKAVVVAADRTVYTIDQRNVRIRKIAPDAARTVTTIAGRGTVGDYGDGGLAFEAEFGFEVGTTPRPSGSLVLDNRTLYVADSLNNRIRRIDLDTNKIDCIAGKPTAGYSGDGGPALDATFNFPMDMELGPDGRLYIADRYNHVIRAIDLTTNVIETVVGTGTKCDLSRGDNCDGGRLATEMPLNEPYGVGFDAAGNMYVADSHNHRILKVTK